MVPEKTRVKTGAKAFVRGEQIREENVFAVKDKTRLTDSRKRSRKRLKNGRGCKNDFPVEAEAGGVDGLQSFMVCRGFAPEDLAEVFLE